MKYINKEDFEKVINTFGDEKLTLEIQRKIHEFMGKEHITMHITPVSKKLITVLSKMRLTADNPENSPNWCATLSDGSQVVWNRKYQEFYHLESHGITHCYFYEWRGLFPEIAFTGDEDLKWLIDNMYSWEFEFRMRILCKYFQGNFDYIDDTFISL